MKKTKYEDLIHQYSKIFGIYTKLEELCKATGEQIYLLNKQLQTFTFFDHYQQSTKDLSRQSGSFLWFQLFNYAILTYQKTNKQNNRAYDRIMNTEPARNKESSHILSNISGLLDQQGQRDQALDYSQRASKIQAGYYPSGHVNITAGLLDIGNVLVEQEKYNEALDYYQRAVNIQENCYLSGHADVSQNLTAIGNVLLQQGKHDEALEYHQ